MGALAGWPWFGAACLPRYMPPTRHKMHQPSAHHSRPCRHHLTPSWPLPLHPTPHTQALVALAGLDDARAVSLMPQHQLHAQIAHFVRQFRTMTALLRHVSGLWNACQPCIVAGFEVGRDAAVRALAAQPPGTFLCRLSMSAATGGLALAVRAAPGHPQTGPDGVLHVLITQADLGSQRVDTLIRDYAGATHLLDVYSGKRVDKRKVGRGGRCEAGVDGEGCGARMPLGEPGLHGREVLGGETSDGAGCFRLLWWWSTGE